MKYSHFNAHSIHDFITGEVPTGAPYFLPDNDAISVDENGLPSIRLRGDSETWDNGRGRLLAALSELRSDDELTEEMAIKLFHVTRDLASFLLDIAVKVHPDRHPLDFSVTYRLYYSEHVLFYPDPSNSDYIDYRAKLARLDAFIAAGTPPPAELMDDLTQQESILFLGKENALAREREMKRRVELHLSDPFIQTVLSLILYGPDRVKEFERQDGDNVEVNSVEIENQRLYPNSKVINDQKYFGVAKTLSDHMSRGVEYANTGKAIKQYEGSGQHQRSRKPVYKIDTAKGRSTEFTFDQDRLAINSAEQFAERIMSLRDPKVIQTFLALMKWSSTSDSAIFRDVPVSDLMELILKPTGNSKFNTLQRREFSEILEYLASLSITASIIVEEYNPKSKKKTAQLKEEKGIKIFRLEATYSVKREYQSIPREELDKDLHFDKSVITKFSGELLPGKSHLFRERANVFSNGLLHFDANKDSKAILLGFKFQNRFNQLQDKEKFIEVDRAWLIDLCDYQRTNQTKPSKATKQIANNLNKLTEAGIISCYSGLTNCDSDRVRIMPPKAPKETIIIH